jgi:hypothetical protein
MRFDFSQRAIIDQRTVKQTFDDFFKDKSIIPLKPTHSNARFSQRVLLGPVYIQSIQILQLRETIAGYHFRLALPS